MSERRASTSPLLAFFGITKVCGVTTANDHINWAIGKGQIHALIGENGAGKSTLVKILFGLDKADSGEIIWKGHPRPWSTPLQAKRHGLSMVHQHFMQAENMTALEHYVLETTADQKLWKRLRPLDWSAEQKKAEQLAAHFQMTLPWTKPVSELSVGEQQRLEILKALCHKAELLILDEPTAVLAPSEVEPFLSRLLKLKDQGMTIILITHKLKEVLKIADTISVLRKGKMVWTGACGDQSEASLAQKMMGEDHETNPPAPQTAVPKQFSQATVDHRSSDQVGLKIELRGGTHRQSPHRKLGAWNFEINRGEIVGIAGVDGNGQDELIEALVHPQNFHFAPGSDIQFQNQSLIEMTEGEAKSNGRAWIPGDRLNQAAIVELTATENFVIGRETESAFAKWGLLKWSQAQADVQHAIEEFDIRPTESDKIFSQFSGGNQQKIIAAREFGREPKWICACHPTRGIDINAARRIHEKLLQFKTKGASTLVLSADIDELFKLCDRILVFYRGEIRDQIPAAEFDVGRIGRAMAGLT